METIKSSKFIFFLGFLLLIVSIVVNGVIFMFIPGEAGLIGDLQWISHLLGIILVLLGYRSAISSNLP